MSQMHIIAEGLLVVFTSAITSLFIANWKERLWLRSKKAEDLYYKTESLHHAYYNLFRKINTVQDAVAKLHNVNVLANIESRMLDLKIQIGIYFPRLEPKFKVVLSATATAYDALERLADAPAKDCQQLLEGLDFAVVNLKDALEQFKRELLISGRVRGTLSEMREGFRAAKPSADTQSVPLRA